MKWFAKTLWDLLGRADGKPTAAVAPAARSSRRDPAGERPRRTPMRDRYDALVVDMKAKYGVRVRRWRSSSSGCAWEVHYHDGSTTRLIEAPRPRGPMSCAIFLHEIGHHAIGFGRYRPRCLEEYHAWRWALETMRDQGFRVTPSVEKRVAESLAYAVAKARRRGLRRLPVELVPYAGPPPGF